MKEGLPVSRALRKRAEQGLRTFGRGDLVKQQSLPGSLMKVPFSPSLGREASLITKEAQFTWPDSPPVSGCGYRSHSHWSVPETSSSLL